MAFGSPESGGDLEGSVRESLQLMVTELPTHWQAERQLSSPGSFRGINKQSGRHVRQLILSKDMISFILYSSLPDPMPIICLLEGICPAQLWVRGNGGVSRVSRGNTNTFTTKLWVFHDS